MATISTIKPAGGGDYANLALWEADADDALSADQWAECYTGGDLGLISMQYWVTGADADHYGRIYAAPGHAHDGTSAGTGAYIDCNGATDGGIVLREPYTRIEWIQFNMIHTADGLTAIQGYDNENNNATQRSYNNLIDSCLFISSGTKYGQYDGGISFTALEVERGESATIKNCIFYGDQDNNNTAIQIVARSNSATTASSTYYLYNNTLYNYDRAGIIFEPDKNSTGTTTLNIVSTNNAVFDCTDKFADYYDIGGGGTLNVTQTYSVSSDASADDWGGAGNTVSKTATNNFDTVGTNVIPKSGGDIIDAGTTIASVTTDAIGTSRPQNAIYDIGAIEKIVVVSYSGFVSVITV